MKQTFTFRNLSLTALAFALVLGLSCSREHSQDGTEEQQEIKASQVSSEADSEAEIIFNGAFDDAMGVNTEVGLGGTGRTEACPDVTVIRLNAPNPFPVKIILDFGINGCRGRDSVWRKGKIIIEYTHRLVDPGAIATTTFDGFYYGNTKVEGTHKITNTSTTLQGNKSWKVEVFGPANGFAKLTRPNGNYTEWKSIKTIAQIEGSGTPMIPLDDQFKIEGSASGKVLRDNLLVLWESNIREPLLKKFSCHWFVKGIIRTIRRNLGTTSPWIADLDFAQGMVQPVCDNLATITINGVPHQITLP
jgi:hypothetical protein